MTNLQPLAQILFGVFAGYWLASLCESFYHKNIGHAGPKVRAFCDHYPRPTDFIMRAVNGHSIVHHTKTFRKDFVTQFQSAEEREELDRTLSPAMKRDMHNSQYGVTINGFDIVKFMLPSLPVFFLFFLITGPWVTLGGLLPMCIYPMMSKFIHPWIHRSPEVAIQEAPWPIPLLLRTPYFRAMYRNHFMHHKYGICNYNFLLGGDYILRVHRSPNEQDLQEMAAIGLPTT